MAARRDFGLSGRQVVAFGGPREDQTDDHGQVHYPMHHDLSVDSQGRGRVHRIAVVAVLLCRGGRSADASSKRDRSSKARLIKSSRTSLPITITPKIS